jgi:hypothetical protein
MHVCIERGEMRDDERMVVKDVLQGVLQFWRKGVCLPRPSSTATS